MYIHFLFILLLVVSGLSKENQIIESQPEILFKYKKLQTSQEKVALKIKFNNAVLYLEQKQYRRAIHLFKQTQKILKVASFLNIGIAYYKLKSNNNAYLYLKKIYDVKEAAYQDPYSYMSASYYLYKLTNNKKFINDIIKIASRKKRLNEYTKRLIVDVYIELKQYKKALDVLLDMKSPHELKMALLYIKTKDFENATRYLRKALRTTTNDDMKNKILWIEVFTDLKANNFINLVNDIDEIQKRARIFHTNLQMPIKLYLNKNKFTAKEYFDMVTKFDINRKIDFIFYFAPFVFADKDVVKLEEKKAFILKNKQNVEELDGMIEYNAKFIKLIKQDPIERTVILKKMIDSKYDTHSYEYYNLGLSYAQIDDFHNAHKYFKKAYDLDKGNKMFSSLTLLSAMRVKININKEDEKNIKNNLMSKNGSYHYFGQFIYKLIYDNDFIPKKEKLTDKFKNSIFFRALYFLNTVDQNGIKSDEPLLVEFGKDPLVYMLKLVARKKDESDYQYISRIQDNMPIKYNDLFIKGPLVITRYYLDILKALGMMHTADLNIDTQTSATYYRTKALVQLYNGNARSTISLIEYLQKKYKLEDRYTYLLLIAALIEDKDIENAYITLALAQQVLKNDVDINFLIGIRFLQELKIASAMKYFKNKYGGELIDFKLVGLEELLLQL